MQHEIKIGDKTIVMVGVPESAVLIKTMQAEDTGEWFLIYAEHNRSEKLTFIKMPFACEIIGTYPGLTEEQAAGIVESIGIGYYKNYKPLPLNLKSALESFDSLMEANEIFTVNTKEPVKVLYEDGSNLDQHLAWQHAQERTSPMWAILEKINN